MKQIRRRLPSGLYTLPFLVFTFVIIVCASYLLAVRGFDGLFSANIFNTPRGILLLVVCPLALLVFLSLFLYGIISESIHTGFRHRFRLRLFLIFTVLVVSATFPQSVIISRYVSTALGSWFNSSITGALVSAERLGELYTAERLGSIEKVTARFLNGLAISKYRARQTEWMNEIRSIDIFAVSCQVYALEKDFIKPVYQPVVEIGDSAQFLPLDRLALVQDGFFTLSKKDTVFRYGQIVHYSNSIYVCIYTSLIPEGYLEGLEGIRTASANSKVIDTLKPFLPLMGIWIFVMFSLPSILMIIILAYFMSTRIDEPVRSISEAVGRLSEGDDSFIVIPHTRDELADTALLINSLTDRSRSNKKPDKKVVIRL